MKKTNILRLCALFLTLLLGACEKAQAPQKQQSISNKGVYSVRFSESGKQAIVGSLHNGGSFWRTSPLDRIYDWNHQSGEQSNILSSAFSGNSKFAATADHRTIVLWNIKTGQANSYWNAPGNIKDMALDKTATYALLGMQDYTATLFAIQRGGVKLRLKHEGIVYDVSLDNSGKLAASGSDDLTAKIWQLPKGKLLHSFKHGNQVRKAELSGDGKYLFTSALREKGKIWDVKTGKLVLEIAKSQGHYRAARFSRNGRWLLTGGSSGKVELWSLKDGKRRKLWRLKPENLFSVSGNVQVEDVAFDGKGIIAAGSNGIVYWAK